MFEFLNPMFLSLAATAAAVPIIIHLIRRNKAVRLHFSAMQFLLSSSRPVVRWLRLKQFLILLLRVLAIALLGLAFARPYLPQKSHLPLWKSGQEEVAIIVDQSASLQAADHLKQARKHLNALFDKMNASTFVTVYVTGTKSGMLVERQPYSLEIRQRVLDQLQKTYRPGPLPAAIRAVDDVLRGSPVLQKELYIISDFQTTAWPEVNQRLSLSSHVKIHLLPTATSRWMNAGIIEVELPTKAGQPWACSVRNFSPKTLRNVKVRLHLNGHTVARKTVRIAPGQVKIVKFTDLPFGNFQPGGFFEIAAKQDQYSPDNRYYFSLQHKQKVNVLAVDGEPGRRGNDELFYLARALSVAGSPFNLTIRRVDRLTGREIRAFDVVVLANVKGINHRSLQALETFVQSGGGLVFALGDQIEPAIYNRLFGKISPGKVVQLGRARLDRSDGELMSLINPHHPILAPFAEAAGETFNSTYIYQYWKIEPAPGTEVLANFTTNAPALMARNFGAGKAVLMPFPLDAEWSEFPVKAIYLPLLYQICEYVKPSQEQRLQFYVGQPIFLGNQFNTQQPIQVVGTGQKTLSIPAGTVIFNRTNQPGHYIFRQGHITRHVAINVDPGDSQTALIPQDKFLSRIDIADEGQSIDGASPEVLVSRREAENRQKLWRMLLAVAFIFLLGETYLANRTPR